MGNRLRTPFKLFLVGIFLIAFAQCGMFAKKVEVKYPNPVTPEVEAAFNQAESKFRAKNYQAATPLYQSFLQTYPYNRLSDQAEFRLGQILMLDRNYGAAFGRFRSLIAKTPDPEVASRASVKAGICQYRLKNDALALDYFSKVKGQFIRRHDKIKTAGLSLVLLNKQGAGIERKAYYEALLADAYQGLSDAEIQKRYGKEAPSRRVAVQALEKWAKTPAVPNQIDPRFSSYQGNVSGPYIDYKLGMAYYNAGNNKMARKYLGDLIDQYSHTRLAVDAKPILEKIGYRGPKKKKTKQYKVGVILPLSGKYENFGVSTLQGMECAVGSKPGCLGVENIQLVTRDDGGSPAAAIKAVEDLVQTEDVTVIVGPLSSASAMAAAKKAQELGVVMISLAQKEGIPDVGDDIYRFSLTPNEQIKALLSYSTKKKGNKLFGIFYPDTNYGKVFLNKFKDMAPRYGAQVTASHGYKNSRDVQGDLRNLKFSVSKSTPQAPLGFNAIFIPDSYVSVLNILPQLEASGLAQMSMLGTNAWNDPNIASRSRGYLDNSIFLDIYFKGSNNPKVKTFVREYQAAYGKTPTTLEAMGYDIIQFLAATLSKNKVSKRREFKPALAGMRGYRGVTGLRSFSNDRESRIRPYILTIQENKIQEVSE